MCHIIRTSKRIWPTVVRAAVRVAGRLLKVADLVLRTDSCEFADAPRWCNRVLVVSQEVRLRIATSTLKQELANFLLTVLEPLTVCCHADARANRRYRPRGKSTVKSPQWSRQVRLCAQSPTVPRLSAPINRHSVRWLRMKFTHHQRGRCRPSAGGKTGTGFAGKQRLRAQRRSSTRL